MLIAVMERRPHGWKVESFDSTKALAVPGVRHVAPIKSGIFGGVAVVADNTWAAMKSREALTVVWDRGPDSDFDSAPFVENLKSAFAQEGYPIRREGDPAKALAEATKSVEAVYEYPFQAHGPVEPMNCGADVRGDSCEVWTSTQTPETAFQNITKMLALRRMR